MARREAPTCRKARTIGLRLSARPPPSGASLSPAGRECAPRKGPRMTNRSRATHSDTSPWWAGTKSVAGRALSLRRRVVPGVDLEPPDAVAAALPDHHIVAGCGGELSIFAGHLQREIAHLVSQVAGGFRSPSISKSGPSGRRRSSPSTASRWPRDRRPPWRRAAASPRPRHRPRRSPWHRRRHIRHHLGVGGFDGGLDIAGADRRGEGEQACHQHE